VLKNLHLVNFRSFPDFTVTFAEGAYLVGPNNAGKSTLLTALRVADALLRYAYRRKPDQSASDLGIHVVAYPINLREFPSLRDSLRFEFGSAETRLELQWKDGARLTAVWPEEDSDDENEAFFYLNDAEGVSVNNPTRAKVVFPALGIVPILGPTEHTEKLLADDYVRQNISGRLSSRHFRNQLRLMQASEELPGFFKWAAPWLDEIRFDSLVRDFGDDGPVVHIFFYEGASRVPKEIVWAGDGIQVWLQLLYHVHRVQGSSTLILDEPEVYLHPDLQRRLVRLLESTGRQIILATHSAEMVAESDGRLTTLVDKTRKRAVRSRSDSDYEMLTATLGTAFNLRLAKALRSRVVVFVEGEDMSVLRKFASALSLKSIASETGITIVGLGGYSNWGQIEPFKWLYEKVLPNALQTFVILDRDYRPDSIRISVMESFEAAGIRGHVWERKELESYLLNPSVIARLSGTNESWVVKHLNKLTKSMESDVFGRLLDETMKDEVGSKRHAVSVTSEFKPVFDAHWANAEYRLRTCPPKQVIAPLNQILQRKGHKAVSMAALARAHRPSEIPDEVVLLLSEIESRVAR
jgi:hypothetical protein